MILKNFYYFILKGFTAAMYMPETINISADKSNIENGKLIVKQSIRTANTGTAITEIEVIFTVNFCRTVK